ncbi:MAG: hypothetical protein J3K34DRAFT_525442 [Monoraphidium minutum]|nr:MAG: hypothetical protein J3K34DRAFT_525442 [Monoraphidium minutum]
MTSLRAHGQAGFHDGRCAADAAFVLRHLIDRARLSPAQPRRRLFAAFIDLEKAYDNVPRIRLVELLASVGIHGPMLATLIFFDRLEAWLAERAPESGVPLLGWGRLRALLYADDTGARQC